MKSNIVGITWHSGKNTWQVRATVDGKRVHIGYTSDLNRAIEMLENIRTKRIDDDIMKSLDIDKFIMYACAIGMILTIIAVLIGE